jgi:hypothetical protein
MVKHSTSKYIKIFLAGNVWWPFGSHGLHSLMRLHASYKSNCDKFLYFNNNHPGYSLFENKISNYYKNISDPLDASITEFLLSHSEIQPCHNKNCIITLEIKNDKDFFIKNLEIYTHDKFFEEFAIGDIKLNELNLAECARRLEPSEKVNAIVNKMHFTKQIDRLNGNYIAAHIRWTDKVIGRSQEGIKHEPEEYLRHAFDLSEKFNTKSLVLNCDNIDAVNEFKKINKKLGYNLDIIYDEEEILPTDDWKNSLFQRWNYGNDALSDDKASDIELQNDIINGFKIYKSFMGSEAMIGCTSSAMYKLPFILRDNENDIDLDCPNENMSQRKSKFALQQWHLADMTIRKQGLEEIKILQNKK